MEQERQSARLCVSIQGSVAQRALWWSQKHKARNINEDVLKLLRCDFKIEVFFFVIYWHLSVVVRNQALHTDYIN